MTVYPGPRGTHTHADTHRTAKPGKTVQRHPSLFQRYCVRSAVVAFSLDSSPDKGMGDGRGDGGTASEGAHARADTHSTPVTTGTSRDNSNNCDDDDDDNNIRSQAESSSKCASNVADGWSSGGSLGVAEGKADRHQLLLSKALHHYIRMGGDFDIIERLIGCGADVNYRETGRKAVGMSCTIYSCMHMPACMYSHVYTCMHIIMYICMHIHVYIYACAYICVCIYIDRSRHVTSQLKHRSRSIHHIAHTCIVGAKRQTSLHIACSVGFYRVVELILDQNNDKDREGEGVDTSTGTSVGGAGRASGGFDINVRDGQVYYLYIYIYIRRACMHAGQESCTRTCTCKHTLVMYASVLENAHICMPARLYTI